MPAAPIVTRAESGSSVIYIERPAPAKNPGLAAVLSFFYCGLGQIYNGQIGKGILLLFAPIPLVILAVAIFIGAAASSAPKLANPPKTTIDGEVYAVDAIPAEIHAKLTSESKRRVREAKQEHAAANAKLVGDGMGRVAGGAILGLFIFAAATFGLWIYGMVDAYSTAERINRRKKR